MSPGKIIGVRVFDIDEGDELPPGVNQRSCGCTSPRSARSPKVTNLPAVTATRVSSPGFFPSKTCRSWKMEPRSTSCSEPTGCAWSNELRPGPGNPPGLGGQAAGWKVERPIPHGPSVLPIPPRKSLSAAPRSRIAPGVRRCARGRTCRVARVDTGPIVMATAW